MSDTAPTSLNCPTCGAPLDYTGASAVIRCKFCGNVSLLPGVLPSRVAAPAAVLDEIRHLAVNGNLIDAIKKYRQVYGAGLREAKEAVEALQAGRMASPSAPGMPPPEELTKIIEEVQRLLTDGHKSDALRVYREKYDVSMARAEYAIEQIQAGQSILQEVGFDPTPTVPREIPAPPPHKWVGLVVTLSILLFVGGIIAFALLQPGGPLSSHYYPNGNGVFLASEAGASPEFVVPFYDSNADNRFIGLVSAESGKLSWKAAPLAGDGYVDALAAGNNLIYAANSTDLLAYRRSDGSLAWQAKMTDKLNYGGSALLVTPVRVVTSNADQTIQAYNADNGSPAWNKRLSGYDRDLHQIGGSLMVVDYVGEDYTYGLIFLDLLTGDQQNAILPTCTYNDYDSNIDPDSGFVFDSGENALYLIYDSSYGCIQKIDPSSGDVIWSTAGEDSFSFVPDGFHYLLTGSTLYFSTDKGLLAVDKSSGELKVLSSNPDYDLLPLSVSGDNLIVRARRTRGTEKFELWGINASSGESAWKIDLQTAKPIDPPNDMAGLVDKTDWGFTWALTPTGLAVIQFRGEPNQLSLETFSLANGTSLGSQTLPLKNISGDFYDIPAVIGSQGSLLYLNIDQTIYSLDLASAKLKRIY